MLWLLLQWAVRLHPGVARRGWELVPAPLRKALEPLVHPIAAGARGGGLVLDVPAAPDAPRERLGAAQEPPLGGGEGAPPSLVSVIVPTSSNRALCEACLRALVRNTRWPRWEVIVVDNGSSDGTRAMLMEHVEREPRLRAVFPGENLGYARGCNLGVRRSRGEVLVLLNDDTVVGPGWLGPLVRLLEADPEVGLVCPRTNEAPSGARMETSYCSLESMEALARDLARSRAGRSFEVGRLTLFCGAARRSVLQEAGLLDERYEVGLFEDDDLCRTLRDMGRSLRVAEDSFVHHVGHASFARLEDREYLRLWEANKRRWEQKWGEPWRPPLQALGSRDAR